MDVPTPAERARSIAARRPPATALIAGERITLTLGHVHDNASADVLLEERSPLVAAAWQAPRGEVAVVLELADPAPVKLREPVRGLLWITGMLRALPDDDARRAAVRLAETRPDSRLLDIGFGAALLRLMPVSMVLADSMGTHSLEPHEFAGADADPFASEEVAWLRHLERDHKDVVDLLAAHLPERLRGGRIRPLGLDRLGLRLRVELAGGDHDVRLAFSQPVGTQAELGAELRRLVGCPFLAEASRSR